MNGTEGGTGGSGGITLARRGLAALETLHALPEDATEVTPEQRATLAGWTGWGPLAKALEYHYDDPWQDLHDRVGKVLSYEAMQTAKNACDTAFYTPPAVIRAIWDLVTGLGFTGGKVLEPGCGSGRFIASAPPGLGIQWTGVEADAASAQIAALLHPSARIVHGRLEKTPLRQAGYDLVIGNVPFSAQGVYDPSAPKAVDSLHGYFLWRALNAARPGGLVAVITSRWTLDSVDTSERDEMAALGVFAGAIRLPGKALAGGGTSAVTDIIVFRRRATPADTDADPSWREPGTVPASLAPGPDDQWRGTTVSRYFQTRPEAVLGELRNRAGQRHGMTLDVALPEGEDLTVALDSAVQDLAANALACGLGWLPRPAAPGPEAAAEEADGARADPAAEGAYTLHGDGTVTRQRDAGHEPVKNPSAELLALIGLCGHATGLFAAEADQAMGANERNRIRQAAMRAYQEYTATYGYLGRSDLSQRQDPDGLPGETITVRRRPPMGGFRSDPDWPTVLALEIWDDETQAGQPAPVLVRHVNAAAQRRQHTADPGEALLLCLDECGRVDLDVIARTLQAEPGQVPGLLEGQIWEDPGTGQWVTRDEYLSGNVRAKLTAAKHAAGRDSGRWQAHVTALEEVQPEDLPPDLISVQLGAPWLPCDVIAGFVRDLLGFEERNYQGRAVTVRYEPLTSTWEVRASTAARKMPAATATWGTLRVNAVNLIEDACNGTTPAVYDTIDKQQVKNPAETALAADKIRDLQERFTEWAWEDPARAERLGRLYNDRFNNTRVRVFDGSLLTFPGLAGGFTPYQHQLDMVWRNVCTPGTLCGHVVGGGKTWIAAASAMKLRQLGLARKPAMIVPNHLLEQTCAEVRRYFPGARILMVTREDLAPERRRHFAAKVAARDWDLVVMTHQQFMALPISPQVQEDYICGLMEELDTAMLSEAMEDSRATAKMLARKRKRLQAKLDALLDAPRDGGITFEQTGIDYVIYDEAHALKNLEFIARAEGFNSAGSKRADDALLKLSWLRGRNPGGRTGMLMTGTPISNSLAELHVLFRYLAPHLLAAQDILSFDGFAAQYIRYETQTEVAPDGSGFRSYRRPRRFVNLPELRAMLWQFADIRTRADLTLDGPKVTLEHVIVPPQPELAAFTATLVDRADRIRGGGVKPDEDNMLSVCNDGRAAALDLRLAGIEPTGPGKVEECARRVAAIYHATRHLLYGDPAGDSGMLWHHRPGALQVVFCDQGTPNGLGDGVYGRLRDLLVQAKVPPGRVAFIHDARNHADRAALFARCRSGEIAVLIGSTEKCGTGVNIQRRLIAIHHLDAPWRPADVEQRDGRGDRPGNENTGLQVYRLVTEGSFDAYMWQALERKKRFIDQVLTGDPHVREAEAADNPQVLSYGELKALATGQPLLMELSAVNAEIARLRNSSAGHKRTQTRMAWDRKDALNRAQGWDRSAEGLREIAAKAAAAGDARVLAPDRSRDRFDGAEAAGAEVERILREARREQRRKVTVGQWRGVHVTVEFTYHPDGAPGLWVTIAHAYWAQPGYGFQPGGHVWAAKTGGQAVLARIDAEIEAAAGRAAEHLGWKAEQERRAAELEPYLEREWPHKAELAAALAGRARIEREIDAQVKQPAKVEQPAGAAAREAA